MTKTVQLALIGAAVVGVGYVLLRSKSAQAASLSGTYLPRVSVSETDADRSAKAMAAMRSVVGAKASTGASSGTGSVFASLASGTNAKVSSALGSGADKILPGSGGYVSAGVGKLGSGAISAVSSLKFW